jgi:fructose-specific phosphotransferase system IIC component
MIVPRRRLRNPAIWVQAGLVVFLLLGAVLLGYETLALSDISRHAPITFYIRCSYAVEKPATFVGAIVVSFIFGHWLWSPRRGVTRPPQAGRTE